MKEIKKLKYVQGQYKQYQDKIIVGQFNEYCNFNGAIYYKEIETDIYKGYIYVEVGYSYVYNKYYLQDAYLDLRGNKVFLMEQKHFPRKFQVDNNNKDAIEDSIPLVQEAIEYLENYLNSNWLEQKPVIKNDILNSKYNHYVFEYNGNKYAQIVNSDIAKLFIKDKNSFIEGNELYRIENA